VGGPGRQDALSRPGVPMQRTHEVCKDTQRAVAAAGPGPAGGASGSGGASMGGLMSRLSFGGGGSRRPAEEDGGGGGGGGGGSEAKGRTKGSLTLTVQVRALLQCVGSVSFVRGLIVRLTCGMSHRMNACLPGVCRVSVRHA
jgi:hypothetical protein